MKTWKPIKNYKGFYAVSSDGEVKSVKKEVPYGQKGHSKKTLKEKIMKPYLSRNGYLLLTLCKNGGKERVALHRLVAQAFLGDPADNQVNHKNGDKQDNRAENLEYVTPQENTLHSIQVLNKRRDGEYSCHSKITREEVKDIRRLYKTGNFTQCDLGDIFGTCRGNISNILNYKTWKNIQT